MENLYLEKNVGICSCIQLKIMMQPSQGYNNKSAVIKNRSGKWFPYIFNNDGI